MGHVSVWVQRGVRDGLTTWCNIPPIFAFEFKDLLDIHNFNQEGNKMKKILRGLVIISCWCI
ncbi:hypothetical protein HanRHA438_Chr08g0362991 [Helianthus annuus]|nr:hypothetical protein HanRHA438_Chr08g0362991 [Helianthus annuus]